MPKLRNALPKYRKHRASGQAVVTLAGKDFYLGPHRSNKGVADLSAEYWKHGKSYYQRTTISSYRVAL